MTADIAKIPQRNIGEWAREIISVCEASRKKRITMGSLWRSYYYTGADDEQPSPYNKIKAHIDRKRGLLYSPVDVRFHIGYDKTKDDNSRRMGEAAASVVSQHFHKRGCDLKFGSGVKWGLIKGCALNKYIWGRNGIDPYLVQPEYFAVWREDLSDLDQQEAFVHTQWLTSSSLARLLTGNPKKREIMTEIETAVSAGGGDDPAKSDYFKTLILGGTDPVQTNPSASASPAGGIVQWMDGPGAELHADVMANLIRVDELWVIDQEKQDYTTIQLAGENTVIIGDIQHFNLCGIKEHHPFVKICPNEEDGYFWGRSEIADTFLLQDMIKKRLYGIERMMRLQENPPWGFFGVSGITEEKWAAQNSPGGFISEDNPQGKAEAMAPKMPENIWMDLHELQGQFDDVTNTPPIMQGQGEAGVRTGAHADTLVRTGSSSIRDDALVVERQLEDAGDLALRFLQAHDPDAYTYKQAS